MAELTCVGVAPKIENALVYLVAKSGLGVPAVVYSVFCGVDCETRVDEFLLDYVGGLEDEVGGYSNV